MTLDRRAHLAGCGWFWTWAVAGASFALVVSVLGVLTVPFAVVLAAFLGANRRARRSWTGLLTGAGGVFLFIAWVQRGPESLDARPWFILGLTLATAGVTAHAVASRR